MEPTIEQQLEKLLNEFRSVLEKHFKESPQKIELKKVTFKVVKGPSLAARESLLKCRKNQQGQYVCD